MLKPKANEYAVISVYKSPLPEAHFQYMVQVKYVHRKTNEFRMDKASYGFKNYDDLSITLNSLGFLKTKLNFNDDPYCFETWI